MATPELNKALIDLIQYVRAMPLASSTATPGAPDIAHQILQKANVNWGESKPIDLGKGGPSIVGRIFDIATRPMQAGAEAVRRFATPELESGKGQAVDFLTGLGAGLRGDINPNEPGTQKTHYSDVLGELGVKNDVARGVGGFALDVLLDPLTYVGAGALRAGAQGAVKLGGKAIGKDLLKTKEIPEAAAPVLSLVKEARKPTVPTGGVREAPLGFQQADDILEQIVHGEPAAGRYVIPKPRAYDDLTNPADISLAQKTAKEYKRKLRTGADNMFTPRQMGLLYANLLRKVGNDHNRAASMLLESERWLTEAGSGFKLWDGSRGKLTEIFDELGGPRTITKSMMKQLSTGKITDRKLLQAFENIRARSAIGDSTILKGFLDDVTKAIAVADETMSPAAAKNVKQAIKVDPKEILLSPAGVQTANKFIDDIAKTSQGYIQVGLDREARILHAIVSGDTRKISDVTAKMNKMRDEAMNISSKELGQQIIDNRVIDTIAFTFNTWFKNPRLRSLGIRYPTLARTAAAMRGKHLNAMLKQYVRPGSVTKQQAQINNAWRAAQGYVDSDDPLAAFFKTEMERLFSSSGIKDEADSVALRSAMTMKDLNEEIGRLSSRNPHFKDLKGLKFHQKTVTDPVTGITRNYEGPDWLKSWETWKDIERPQEVLYGLQTAVEAVARNYAMLDDLAARFASEIPTATHTVQLTDIPRLRGYYFPKEIADEVPIMMKNINDMYQSKAPIVRLFDKALSSWKRGVTIYVPSHHIRNLMGDVFLSWMAGVNNPARYVQSMKVIRAFRHKYPEAHIDELLGKSAKPVGGQTILKKNGVNITDEMLYHNAVNHGLMLSAKDIEDIFGEDLLGKWKPFKGNVKRIASSTAELREHYAIMAHYIDAVAKSKKTKLPEIFEDAAGQVRKWHPNGTDLTATERNVFRRILPFYSWTRKAIPLVAESIMFNPGKVSIIPKGMAGLQESLGIEPGNDFADPFPVDQAFPGWLREQGIGPLGRTDMGGLAGLLGALGRTEVDDQSGQPVDAYTVLGTRTNPVTDILSSFQPNPFKGIMEMTNPAIQTLFELGKGQTLSGREIASDPFRYAVETTPFDPLYRIFNRPGASRGKDETPLTIPGTTAPQINIEALLNALFAAGIVGTGPYVQQGRR